MLELEESRHAVRVHVIGDRGPAPLDRLLQNIPQRGPERQQSLAREPPRLARRPDSRPEERKFALRFIAMLMMGAACFAAWSGWSFI